MGICCSSSADSPTPTTTGQISSVTSQATSNTTSSATSRGSRFSASSGDEAYPNGQILPAPDLRTFTFAELRSATKNFRPEMVLGEGGFGKVFKGWIDEKTPGKSGSGTLVAVKKLNSESLQGFEEWQSEVSFLGRLSHPHLVRLIGYCLEDSELLLVYEFMQKGSLENHLFGRGSTVQSLEWNIRLKIVIGAAKGLSFLHSSEKQVIYRDFKASNILLDGNYTAKISDFGLAKLGPSESRSHVTTRVMGTYGYAAPEYVTTGLRALDPNRPSGQHNLVDWVKPFLSDRRKLKSVMDQRLEGKYPSKAAYRIAQLALTCLEAEPKNRPSMKEVVETLEEIESTNEKPTESRHRSSRHTGRKHGQQPSHRRTTLAPNHEASRGNHTPPRLR